MTTESINTLVSHYVKIKKEHVDTRLIFYNKRVNINKYLTYFTYFLVGVISFLVIPYVTNFHPDNSAGISNTSIISGASILLGVVSVFKESFKWDVIWKQYSTCIVQIESAIGHWKLEVEKTLLLSDMNEVNEKLNEATDRLLSTVDKAVLSEMKIFFGPSNEEIDQTLDKPNKIIK
jgi:hypothetical protein